MGTGRRDFLKIWCEQALNGTIHEAPLTTRGIFWTLALLIGNGNLSDWGILGISERMGYTDDQIAELLNSKPLHWAMAKEWLSAWRGDKKPLIAVLDANVIAVVHWPQFQPEYDRQKKYRNPESRKIQLWLQGKIDERLQALVTGKGD